MASGGEVVVSGLLKGVSEKIANFATGELISIWKVRDEIERLSFRLSMIERFLADAEEKQLDDRAVQEWLGSLKQVIYDADDLIEGYATSRALYRRRGDGIIAQIHWIEKVCENLCGFSSLNDILSSYAMAYRVRAIQERLDDIAKCSNDLGLQSNWVSGSCQTTRRRVESSSILPDKSDVIGREHEKKKIICLLSTLNEKVESSSNDRKNNISVISIFGMGGLGKTTLAQYIFNDREVEQCFQLRMWVCVTSEFDSERITKQIIDEALSFKRKQKVGDNVNWNTIQKQLQEEVEGMRFLLVLDDIWEDDHTKWDNLVKPLRSGGKGSKILITTRNKKVADMVKDGDGADPVNLSSLSNGDLLWVFKRCAFRNCKPGEEIRLEAISEQIVHRLKGSPLAAKTLGHLLSTNLDVKYWTEILKNRLWKFQQRENDILPILRLSYQHLPTHLKQCFAFCSLFPEDYRFDEAKLVQLWMAQCFIQSESGMLMEDIGKEYFKDLCCRSFFEKGGSGHSMHDLIHELAENVSKHEYLRMSHETSMRIPETVRHISIITKNVDLCRIKELHKPERVRTLLFLSRYSFDLNHALLDDLFTKLTCSLLDDLFTKLTCLRVLGLPGCKIEVLPESIGDLKHLRYLDLSRNPFHELPESLGHLYNLQVLILGGCYRLQVLPKSIKELVNLRHLKEDRELLSKLDGIGKLTSLQELKIGGEKMNELKDMNMLRRLCIENLATVRSKDEVVEVRLSSKEHLDVLELSCNNNRDVSSLDKRLDEEVLEGLKPHGGLRELVISDYGGVRSPTWMEDGSLYYLETIKLYNWMNWERWERISDEHGPSTLLPCLRQLCIQSCPKLRELPPLPPALTELTIEDCEELESLKGFGLASLKSLDIRRCPKLTWSSSSSSSISSCTSLSLPSIEKDALPSSLEEVCIYNCGEGMDRCLSVSLQNFTCLSSLTISSRQNTISSLLSSLGQHLAATLTELRMDLPAPSPTSHPISITHGEEGGGLRALTSLRDLSISTAVLEHLSQHGAGGVPSSLEKLHIFGRPPLLDVVDDNDHALSTCLQGLTSLKELSIQRCSTITSLPGEDVLCHLTALCRLLLGDCQELMSLGGLHALASLQTLMIGNCPKLQLLVSPLHTSPMSSPLRRLFISRRSPRLIKEWLLQLTISIGSNFPSLHKLVIDECPELKSFGGGGGCEDDDEDGRELDRALLSLAPSLTSLHIYDCQNLRSLPASLRCFSALERLVIHDCPQIRSLPENGLPPSLQRLVISKCPALRENCREEGGPDWSNISTIPRVWFDSE